MIVENGYDSIIQSIATNALTVAGCTGQEICAGIEFETHISQKKGIWIVSVKTVWNKGMRSLEVTSVGAGVGIRCNFEKKGDLLEANQLV